MVYNSKNITIRSIAKEKDNKIVCNECYKKNHTNTEGFTDIVAIHKSETLICSECRKVIFEPPSEYWKSWKKMKKT